MDQQIDYNLQELHRITKLYDAPEFVKSARLEESGYIPDKNAAFADPINKKFPCHTPAATWISAALFLEKRNDLDPATCYRIESQIRKYASIHGISSELRKLEQRIDAVNEENIPLYRYGIVVQDAAGNLHKKFPLRNTYEIKKASEWLEQNRKYLPWKTRNKFALKILKCAKLDGVTLENKSKLHKIAGIGICSASDIVALFQQRKYALKQFNYTHNSKKLLEKAANLIGSKFAGKLNKQTLDKIAEIITTLDEYYGLQQQYGKTLDYPEDIIYGITKEAVDSIKSELVGNKHTGNYYKLSDLRGLDLNLLTAMGPNFVSHIKTGNVLDKTKLAKILPKLSREEATRFDELALLSGVKPTAVGTRTPIGEMQ